MPVDAEFGEDERNLGLRLLVVQRHPLPDLRVRQALQINSRTNRSSSADLGTRFAGCACLPNRFITAVVARLPR